MPFIHLTTFVAAPVERVFDLSRSINLHKMSMTRFAERPIAGRIDGLIEENETVTWEAKHLFKKRVLTSKITEMKRPFIFIDEQLKGDFKSIRHEHIFKACDNGTIMIDQFNYELPYGRIGRMVNHLFMQRYLKKLLLERNEIVKTTAETGRWKNFLQ
jgi:ligand-binding SRPBCC domain-containing protein